MIEDGLLNADLKPVDRLGRTLPRRLNILTFAKALPGFTDQFIAVPSRFYAKTPGVAQVECPCGQVVSAELGNLTRHDGCERIYLYMGKDVMVGNSPAREESGMST